MDDPLPALKHWLPESAGASIRAVAGRGFSGARVWHVELAGEGFALRQWPFRAPKSDRLASIHAFQRHLAASDLPVPAPIADPRGATFLELNAHLWELAPWMPGAADFWQDPRPVKLEAALRTLAEMHVAAASIPFETPQRAPFIPADPALGNRVARLKALCDRELPELADAIERLPAGANREHAEEALRLVRKVAPREVEKSGTWTVIEIPLQWRVGDIWHDHVLFTGDRVTGIIDFGGASVGAPAADVARLLGSMVADDVEGWKVGLAGYNAVRRLNVMEELAVEFFDSSGTVLSAVNWIHWLFRDPASLPPAVDRSAAMERLERLIGRLKVLANRPAPAIPGRPRPARDS